MKKNLVVFALFMLFFAVSCDSGPKFNNPNDMNSDAYQGDKDSETPDDDGVQTDSEKENDDADSESVITDNDISDSSDESGNTSSKSCSEQGSFRCKGDILQKCDQEEWKNYEQCSSDKPCNAKTGTCEAKNEENCDSDDDSDTTPADETDTEPVQINPCDDNPCSGIANSTGSCAVTNGGYACGCLEHYSWTGSVCKADSRVVDCTGRPANATWNTAESISQTWDGEEWYPSEAGTYNTNPSSSECRFKCEPDYDWNGSQCWKPVDPCDPNPCLDVANSTKECIETGDTTYSCKCNSGYNWIGNQCRSNSTPSLPECSTADVTPCYDSTSCLTWSKKSGSSMKYSAAISYCSDSEMNGYGGYSDWRLPNISELRTLIQNCSATQFPQIGEESCGITHPDHLSDKDDWNSACSGCTYDSNNPGQYSKFGDTGWFWSSSTRSDDTGYAWIVLFSDGGVNVGDFSYLSRNYYVRCVR